ncbi:MAG: hypothetical protein CL928_03930 [Deltaproteobacteria bacterium]|nr:hypothetical protein [Deltaproteobacteria bacterium]
MNHPAETTGPDQITAHQAAATEKVAKFIVRFGLTVPAILALESLRPLSFVGSQFMYVLSPAVTTFLSQKDWDAMAGLLEQRAGMEYVLGVIERLDREQGVAA